MPYCVRLGRSSPTAAPPPIFGPCPLWPNGWMDQDATWYGGRPRPRRWLVGWSLTSLFSIDTAISEKKGPGDIVLDEDPAPRPKRGIAAPTFRPMSLVAKRSRISATVELLYKRSPKNEPYFDCLLSVQHFVQKSSRLVHVRRRHSKPRVGSFRDTVCGSNSSTSLKHTRAVQPVATCRQSSYLHKPAIVIVTSPSSRRLAPTALAALAAPVLIMTSFSL